MLVLNRFGWLGFFLTFCGLAIAIALLNRDFFEVETVNVVMSNSSNQKIEFSRIKTSTAEKVSPFLGQPIWDVDLNQLMIIFSEDRRVKSVRVSRQFPNKINVHILPRKPVLILLNTKNRFHPISIDAFVLPPLNSKEIPDVPILRGLHFFKNETKRKQAVSLVRAIPKEGQFSYSNVSEMRWEKDKGFVLYMMSNRTEVYVGQKLENNSVHQIEKVMKYLNQKQLEGRIIDARFAKKVVVRLRNAP